jgi:enoyl-CoA hydratase/carnithine racemase
VETVSLEKKGPVAWVWLNMPDSQNAINQKVLDELRQTFEGLNTDEATRCIILAAKGKAFSVGFDIAWMVEIDVETVAGQLGSLGAIYDLIETCKQPLIAVVDGPAMGGGLLLTLVADFRLASERAVFGVPEVKIGIFPPLKLLPRLERLVGLSGAKSLVLTGKPMSVNEANRAGLVDRIIPRDALYDQAQAFGEQLSALPTTAVQLSKAAFNTSQDPNYPDWESTQFLKCWASPERERAMRIFLQARHS